MSPSRNYSNKPMSRLQFLMLVALERGETLNEASDWALQWERRHPREAPFEYRTYAQWRQTIGTAGWNGAQLVSAQAAVQRG